MTAIFGAAWQATILLLPALWLAGGRPFRALMTATFALALSWWSCFAIGSYNLLVVTLSLIAAYVLIYMTVGRAPSARLVDRYPLRSTAATIVYAIVLLSAFVVLRAPVAGWDALTYHLEFPARWISDGAIKRGATDWGDLSPTYYPQLTEILYGWFLLAPAGGRAIARTLPFLWWAGIFALCRTWFRENANGEAEQVRANLSALVVATLPELCSGLLAAGNDLALTFWALGTAYLLRRLSNAMSARQRLETWVGIGLAGGALSGTKYTGLIYLLTMLLASLAFVFFFGRGRRPLLESARSNAAGIFVALFRALPLGPAFALLTWLQTGNPLYPAALQIGPFRLHGYYPSEFFAQHEFARGTALWRHPGYLIFFFLLLAGLPRLPVALRRSHLSNDVGRAAWLSAATLLSFWFISPFHHARLMLPCVVLAAPLLRLLPEKRALVLLWGALLAQGVIVLVRLAEYAGPLLEPALSFRELTTLTLKEVLLLAASRRLPSHARTAIAIAGGMALLWIGDRPDWKMYARSERPIARDWAHAENFLQRNDRVALIGSNAPYAWRGPTGERQVFLANGRPEGLQPLHRQSRRIAGRDDAWHEIGPTPTPEFLVRNLATLDVDAVIVARLPGGEWPIERRWLLEFAELRSALPHRVTLEESEIFFRSATFQKRNIYDHGRRT